MPSKHEFCFDKGNFKPLTSVNYFELFNLPQNFNVDENALEKAYLNLQMQVHPDKFATAETGQQLLALQWGSLVNDAYDILTSPVKRGVYMLETLGVVDVLSNHKLPAHMMTQQFMWREMLEEADDLSALQTEVKALEAETLTALHQSFEQQDNEGAADAVVILQFVTKFSKTLKRKLKANKKHA